MYFASKQVVEMRHQIIVWYTLGDFLYFILHVPKSEAEISVPQQRFIEV